MNNGIYLRELPLGYFKPYNLKYSSFYDTVKRWYIARAFVLDLLGNISFAPGDNNHLHVEVNGDSPMMLAVIRQVALSAHYPNFVEYDNLDRLVCKNRTVITLISDKKSDVIIDELQQAENLNNLLKYCKYSVYGTVYNEDSYLDVELEILHERHSSGPKCIFISEDEIMSFVDSKTTEEVFTIDTRMAVYASRAYNLGAVVNNIQYEDILCVERYSHALDTFKYMILQDDEDLKLVNGTWYNNITEVRNGLSNLFCSDCFKSRELAIKKMCSKEGKEYEELSEKDRNEIWASNNHALSLSEHSRWNVEKLIMGYNPLIGNKKHKYECMLANKRVAYYKTIKNDSESPSHIDLCTYRDLRRVDPDNMKYDSFLMMAIPMILDKTR